MLAPPVPSYDSRPRVAEGPSMACADIIANSRKATPSGSTRKALNQIRPTRGRTRIFTAHRTPSSASAMAFVEHTIWLMRRKVANASASIVRLPRISSTSTPGSATENQRMKRTSTSMAAVVGSSLLPLLAVLGVSRRRGAGMQARHDVVLGATGHRSPVTPHHGFGVGKFVGAPFGGLPRPSLVLLILSTSFTGYPTQLVRSQEGNAGP